MMSPLRLAILSLSRHRLTTFIAVISIAISVACSGTLLRLYQVSESRFSVFGEGGDAIIGAKAGGIEILLGSLNAEGDYPGFLPYKLFESLRSQQSVQHGDGQVTTPSYIEHIIPMIYFAKLGEYRVIGTDQGFFQRPQRGEPLRLREGSWFVSPSSAKSLVIGSQVAKDMRLSVGDTLTLDLWGKDIAEGVRLTDFEVVGIMEATYSTWDRMLYSTVEVAHEAIAKGFKLSGEDNIWGADVLHYFLVYLRPGGLKHLETLVNKRTVGQSISVESEKQKLKALSGLGQKIGMFVTFFVIFLSGLCVCSLLITRFEGMSLQVAVLRAIGYTRKELALWLFWEGLLLGLVGVFAGGFLDLLIFPLMRGLLHAALPPPELVSSSVWQSGVVWLVALAATVLSVIVPMLQVSRQDAHSFLKGH
jgi:putative ABC transport system permease protein